MAFGDFVVEDGTGLSTATSYLSVADGDAYVASHGDASNVWCALGSNKNKQAALMYATQWLDGSFNWLGVVFDPEQALRWPRIRLPHFERREVIDTSSSDSVPLPDKLKQATIEAALMHASANVNVFQVDGIVTKGPVEEVEVDTVRVKFTNARSDGRSVRNPDKAGSRAKYIAWLVQEFTRPGGVGRA